MVLCFDKDIFAYNLTTKVKLKKVISESFSFFLLYLLVFEFCP